MIRVLAVLDDTDRDDTGLVALELHAALSARGLEMRTVALGPGRSGGLDEVVPVLGPSPRSLASLLQLRREVRWADVAAGHGPASLAALRRVVRRGRTPIVNAGEVVVTEGADPVPAWEDALRAAAGPGAQR